jgi:hypothetical protein
VELGAVILELIFVVLEPVFAAAEVEVDSVLLSVVAAFNGDLKGVLKGERNGLESVLEATSILRRLAAGVDILRASSTS